MQIQNKSSSLITDTSCYSFTQLPQIITMEPYHGSWVLPIGPRDGGQGRRQVSPVWWSSDESSYFVSGLDERVPSDFFDRDKVCYGTTQEEQSVQTKALNPSTSHAAKAEPDMKSFPNRLRRRAASDCLSAQYLESGGCSNYESREAGAVEQQTIRPTVATQGTTEGTNHRMRHSCQLSADMNQPELVKISSGPRRDDAQTVAPTLEAGGLWDERNDSTGQQDAHKAGGGTGTSTEDGCTRSSIASEEAIFTVCVGTVSANVGFVEQLEAPNVSPQRAEFLNVHSNGVRHESLRPPARRRHLSIPQNRVEEQSNLGRLESIMAKYDGKVKAHVKVKQRPRRQAMMRPDVASREALVDHRVRLTKTPNSRHRRKPLGPRVMPRYSDSMRLRGEDIPAYLLLGGNVDDRGRRFEQAPPVASGPSEARQSRGNFELGHAQAVSFSKPGKASVIKICPQKSKSFDLGSLGLVETEIMFSAGAVARSARCTNMRTEGTRPRSAPSSATAGAPIKEPLLRGHQKSRIPGAIPGTEGHTVRSYKRSVGGSQIDMDRDVRFPQLVRRLKTNEPLADEDAGQDSAQDLSRFVVSAAPASEQRSTAHPRNDRYTTGRIQSSFPEQKYGHLSLQDEQCQSRIPDEDDSMLVSPPKTLANPKSPPGNSGCPSLISDDGQEPFDIPEAAVNEHARIPIFQGPSGTSGWRKEDGVSTAVDETSSEGSSTLVHISVNDSGLLSAADTEAIHDANIRADEIHAGVGTSSHSEYGRGSWATRAIAPAISFQHGKHDAGSDAQRRGGMSARVPRPDELTLYPLCAILRWLVSTTDAPGTPGMWHESSEGLELFVAADEYELLIDDKIRADLLRMLRCLSGAAELPPDPYAEVWAFIRNMYPPSVP